MKNNDVAVGSQSQSFADAIKMSFEEEKEERDFYEVTPKLTVLEKNWQLWRLDRSGIRFYFNPNREEFYPSTTSIIWSTLKESKFLSDWKLKLAVQNNDPSAPENYMNERAYYGTLMHIVNTEALLSGKIHSDEIEGAVYLYRDMFDLHHINVRPWVNELKADVSAFYEWIMVHEIEPIAVEIPIFYPVFNTIQTKEGEVTYFVGWIAGTIDLVCRLTVRKDGGDITPRTPANNRTREIAIVDYKSGKKGFYTSHEIQALSYLDGWNWIQHQYLAGKFQASRAYNFAPANSTGKNATFKFVNQVGSKSYLKFPHLLHEFMLDGKHEVPQIRYVEGQFELGKSGSDNVHLMDASEYIKQKYEVN